MLLLDTCTMCCHTQEFNILFSCTTGGDINATAVWIATVSVYTKTNHHWVIQPPTLYASHSQCHSIVVRVSQLSIPLCQYQFLHLARTSSPVSSHPNLAQAHIQSNVSFSFFSGLPSGKSCFSKWI